MEAGGKAAPKTIEFSALDVSRLDTLYDCTTTIQLSLSLTYRLTKSIVRPMPAYDVGANASLNLSYRGRR